MPSKSLTLWQRITSALQPRQLIECLRDAFQEIDRRLAELNADGSGVVLGEGAVTARTVNADVAGAGLVKNAATLALDVKPDGATLEVASDQVRVRALGIGTSHIAALAVTDAKLATDSVTTVKILNLSVTTAKIDNLAVTTSKVDANAITQAKMAAQAVGPTELTNALAALIQGTPDFTVGAEAANVISVTVQLKDCDATNLGAAHVVQAWLSNAAGGAVTGTAPSGAVSATTGTIIREWTSKTHMALASDSSGVIVLSIEEAGAATWYLNVEYQGKLFSSGAITFA